MKQLRILGRLDGTCGATITVGKARQLLWVKPLRRRRPYTLPVALAAAMIVAKVVKAELVRWRAPKKQTGRSAGAPQRVGRRSACSSPPVEVGRAAARMTHPCGEVRARGGGLWPGVDSPRSREGAT